MMLFIASAIAFAISAILTPLLRSIALRRGSLDIPNERSSHTQPTPRNGGLAICAGIAAAFVIARAYSSPQLCVVAACVVVLVVIAIFDERSHIDPRLRLVLQIAAAIAAASFGGLVLRSLSARIDQLPLGPFAFAATIFWVVGVINGYNFMDGVNGIAAIEAIVCGSAQAALFVRSGDLAAAGVVAGAAASAAAFLVYNRRGTVFMGDTGSTTLGFLFAVAAVRLSHQNVSFVAAALPLAPFLLDTLVTLFRRAIRGEPLLRAHRSHFYQRLNQRGWSHIAVALTWGALAAVSAIAGLLYDAASGATQVAMLLAVVVLHVVVFTLISVRVSSITSS